MRFHQPKFAGVAGEMGMLRQEPDSYRVQSDYRFLSPLDSRAQKPSLVRVLAF